ncbi:MAG TPA: transcriptional regulator [Acholeplasmataceae bacterium]|nr:transcriptional regulator [Acholeplasmataceae bacterium]
MKLVIVIVSSDDSSNVMKELIKKNFFCTQVSAKGGFLKRGNAVIMIGTKAEKVDQLIQIVSDNSKTRKEMIPNSVISEFGMFTGTPIEISIGGATIFVIDAERMVKI